MKALNELVALGKKATGGEWTTDVRNAVVAVNDQANSGFVICATSGCDKSSNAAFIAAANPETILAIAEAFRSLEQRAEAAEAALAEEKRINSKLREDRAGLARECNAFEAKLAELEKQESEHANR